MGLYEAIWFGKLKQVNEIGQQEIDYGVIKKQRKYGVYAVLED